MGHNSTWTTEKEDQLIEFMDELKAKRITIPEIAEKFGVNRSTISMKISTFAAATKAKRQKRKNQYLERFDRNLKTIKEGKTRTIRGVNISNRVCVICTRAFSVNIESSQMTDCFYCEDLWQKAAGKNTGIGWHSEKSHAYNNRGLGQKPEKTNESIIQEHGEHQNKSKQESKKMPSGAKKTAGILNSEKKNTPAKKDISKPTKRKSNDKNVNDIKDFLPKRKSNTTKNLGSEKTKTLILEGENGMNTTTETESKLIENPTNERKRLTPHADSMQQYLTSAMVESASMNLIDSTSEHLHKLMKGMSNGHPDKDVRSKDPELVNAACNAAKNIRELMKLKLDVLKLGHEINKETGIYKE